MYRRSKLSWRAAAILAVAAGLSGTANAELMNFETASAGSLLTVPFEQEGIRLSLVTGHYDLWNCASFPCPAGNGMVAGLDSLQADPSTVRISLASGSLFNLDNIQILSYDSSGSVGASNGSTYDFRGPGGTLAGFRGIAFFEISSSVDVAGGFLFDNIAVTAVPEPSTLILLLLPFATLAAIRERSRRSIPQ